MATSRTGSPRLRMSISPCSAISAARARTRGRSDRHVSPPATLAASLGQIVRPGARLRSRVRMAASTLRADASGSAASHHPRPRSPSATLASLTRVRNSRTSRGVPAPATPRRAAISSLTSSCRRRGGMCGSDARHRRPLMTMKAASGGRGTATDRVRSREARSRQAAVSACRQPQGAPNAFSICCRTSVSRSRLPPFTSAVAQPTKPMSATARRT